MRKILFRGKRVDNGEWVKGCLIEDTEFYEKSDYHAYIVNHKHPSGCFGGDIFIEIIPETVGQYTGLTDKNGTKIFEGDIVRRRNKELFLNNIFDFKIVFIPVKACFTAVDISGGNVTFISDYINNKYDIEVIGNIHDNPELLEGVGNEVNK